MIIEKDAYLAHFGVKGQKWGVRNQRESSGRKLPKQKKAPLTTDQKVRRIKIGLAVAMGTFAVANVISQHRSATKSSSMPLKLIKGGSSSRDAAAEKWLRQNTLKSNPKVNDIRPTAKAKKQAGTMSKETQDFIRAFTAKQNEQIKYVNADLRKLDNELNIPIHAREYLKEWI